MPVINYNGQNIQTFRCDSGLVFRFLPGANEISQEVWDELQKNESVQGFQSRGKIMPVKVRKPVTPKPTGPGKLQKMGAQKEEDSELETLAEADISKMDAWSAVQLVEGVIDLPLLEKFNTQEHKRNGGARKTVVKALEVQIQALTAPDTDQQKE